MPLKHYLALARPGHWFKNVFILPGMILALFLTRQPWQGVAVNLLVGLVSACLITSANYTINEWLDAEFDRHHPLKKDRPSVQGLVSGFGVRVQYVLLALAGLGLAWAVSLEFCLTALLLLLMGAAYNIKPFRTKDKAYLDVLSESVNNPIRLLLGWFMVTASPLPPSSLLIAYWMGGAFLMAVKRYAEIRLIADRAVAARYRRSFSFYTEENLLLSILFYAMCFAFFFSVFMIKHRIELLLSLPLFAAMFAWYLHIGMGKNSPAQRPEQLYKQTGFMAFVVATILVVGGLFLVHWPLLHWFLNNSFGDQPQP